MIWDSILCATHSHINPLIIEIILCVTDVLLSGAIPSHLVGGQNSSQGESFSASS